jgi:hypothetical protein
VILYGRAAIRFNLAGAHCATTGFNFITDFDEFFPDEDFSPYIGILYDDIDDNTGNANRSCSTVPYVLLIVLVDIMMLFLVLVSCLELSFSYSLLDGMPSLFPLILVMFYLLFFLVNLCGKFCLYFQ